MGTKQGCMEGTGCEGANIQVHKHMASWGSEGCPQEFLYFRLSQIASGAFSDTLV